MTNVAVVTESLIKKGEVEFRAARDIEFRGVPPHEEALVAELHTSRARIAVLGANRCGPDFYEALARNANGKGALIARFGVGHDSIDKPLARRLGIIVTNTPGTLDESVAEHTIWLLGNLAKQINRQEQVLRGGMWATSTGVELRGKLLAVVGFGGIGRRVSAAAHFGFGMRVVAVGRSAAGELEKRAGCPLSEILRQSGADEYTDNLEEALSRADAVTLHAPANDATRHLIDRRRLAMMRTDSLLVNTARGALIDEAALYDALITGTIGGAALDVFEHEPYRPVTPDKDLRTLANVLLTPHIGSDTREANARMAASVVASIRGFVAGKFEELPRVDLP